ncbi:MAG: hypothetical protein H7249_00265 [Chitinophagaceae bacterium]|nr:hypothetical protein [Oligoflexus sp.]
MAVALLEGPDHVFKHTNILYDRLVGRSPRDGATVREEFPDLEGQPFFDLLDNVFRTGVPYIAKEAPIQLELDGKKEEHFLDFNYSLRVGLDGAVVGISATVIDVTYQVTGLKLIEASTRKLQAAQVEIDEKKRKLEIIFENATPAMAMVEERDKCLEAGYTDFLSKAIDRTKLIEVLKNQLNLD